MTKEEIIKEIKSAVKDHGHQVYSCDINPGGLCIMAKLEDNIEFPYIWVGSPEEFLREDDLPQIAAYENCFHVDKYQVSRVFVETLGKEIIPIEYEKFTLESLQRMLKELNGD